jgi:tetratricopeptide (TPR) repeat protein
MTRRRKPKRHRRKPIERSRVPPGYPPDFPPFPPEALAYGRQQQRGRTEAELRALFERHYEQGRQLALAEQDEEALRELHFGLAVLLPGDVNFYGLAMLGLSYACLGRNDEARRALEYAIELGCDVPNAYQSLAQVCLDLGRYRQCIATVQDMRTIFSLHTVQGLPTMAHAYHELGRLDIALRLLHQAIELEPDNLNALQGLGACYEDLLDLERASYYYGRALEVNPTDTNTRSSLERVKGEHYIARMPITEEEIYAWEKARIEFSSGGEMAQVIAALQEGKENDDRQEAKRKQNPDR